MKRDPRYEVLHYLHEQLSPAGQAIISVVCGIVSLGLAILFLRQGGGVLRFVILAALGLFFFFCSWVEWLDWKMEDSP